MKNILNLRKNRDVKVVVVEKIVKVNQKRSIWFEAGKIIMAVILVSGLVWGFTHAGSLTPSSSPAPTSYTLGDLYNKLTTGATTTAGSHSLSTTTAPTPSFRTLTEIYNAIPDFLTLSAATTSVPRGIYGTTTLNAVDTDLTATNIKSGVNIFGIAGSYAGGGSGAATLKTGQVHCNAFDTDGNYNPSQVPCAGTNQDGDLQRGTARSYTDNSDGTITDNSTSLMWEKCAAGQATTTCSGSPTALTFDNSDGTHDAINYCENLSLGGHTDWHLPNVNELISIVDFGKVSPAINTTYFPNTQSGYYWSSTAYEDYPLLAWIVYFHDGGVGYDAMNSSYPVRCVR